MEAILTARRSHPHWGARKILAWLGRKQPALTLPVPSTVSAVFAKYGLSRARHARRRTPPYTDPFAEADAPNRIWCADFKGDFRTGDGRRCYPLTLTDACSRMLLRCTALRSRKRSGSSLYSRRRFGGWDCRTGSGPTTARPSRVAEPEDSPAFRSGGSGSGFATSASSRVTPNKTVGTNACTGR